MNFDEYNYEEIEQFLAKELKGEALQKFEAALRSDKSLAAEVELIKEMNELLTDSPENELRKNLQYLNSQISEDLKEEPSSKNPYLFLLWLVPILLLAGLLFFNPRIWESSVLPPANIQPASIDVEQAPAIIDTIVEPLKKPRPSAKVNSVEQEDKEQGDDDESSVANDDDDKVKLPRKPVPKAKPDTLKQNKGVKDYNKPMANIINKDKPKEKSPTETIPLKQQEEEQEEYSEGTTILHDIEAPIYAEDASSISYSDAEPFSPPGYDPANDFLPIAELDSIIKASISNNKITVKIRKRMEDSLSISPNEKLNFLVSGSFNSKGNLDSLNFKLHLFTNEIGLYQEFISLYSYELPLKQAKDRLYPFLVKDVIRLQRGLYYYIIEETGSKQFYFVDKFKVGERED